MRKSSAAYEVDPVILDRLEQDKEAAKTGYVLVTVAELSVLISASRDILKRRVNARLRNSEYRRRNYVACRAGIMDL